VCVRAPLNAFKTPLVMHLCRSILTSASYGRHQWSNKQAALCCEWFWPSFINRRCLRCAEVTRAPNFTLCQVSSSDTAHQPSVYANHALKCSPLPSSENEQYVQDSLLRGRPQAQLVPNDRPATLRSRTTSWKYLTMNKAKNLSKYVISGCLILNKLQGPVSARDMPALIVSFTICIS
jgi:hypothetical protein